MTEPADWINKLNLIPHPEGGFYREFYRSDLVINSGKHDGFFPDGRCASTAIYYLLKSSDISAFHRIKSDEIWHFHCGSSLTIHIIDESNGEYSNLILGGGSDSDQHLSAVVKKGLWFAAGVNEPDSYVLAGCTVSPGFDFMDFELGQRSILSDKFPQYRDLIYKFTSK